MREVALEGGEVALVEDLGDEAHVLDDGDVLAVAHRDARRLLPAVLQRVQPEVGELGNRLVRGVHPEHATRVRETTVHRTSIARRHRTLASISGGARARFPEWPTTWVLPLVHRILRCRQEHDRERRRRRAPQPRAPGRAARRRRGPRAPLSRPHLLQGRPRHQHPPDRLGREGPGPQWRRRDHGRDLPVPGDPRCSEGGDPELRRGVRRHAARRVRGPRRQGPLQKARAGEIPEFTGVSDPYEPPLAPEIHVSTTDRSVAASAAQVLSWLEEKGWVRAGPAPRDPELAAPASARLGTRLRARAGSRRARHSRLHRRGSTSNAPSATRRSPPASPITETGTPARPARATTASTRAGSTESTTRDADSEKQASASPTATRKPVVAGDRHLRERRRRHHRRSSRAPRRPSGRRRAPATSVVQRPRDVEVGDGRCTATPVVHRRPLGAAELRARSSPRSDDAVAGPQRGAAAARTSSSSSRPMTPTTGVGSMSAPRDSL